MAYTKTNWQNGATPAINADNLNHMEQGIYDAHERLDANAIGTKVNLKTFSGSNMSFDYITPADGYFAISSDSGSYPRDVAIYLSDTSNILNGFAIARVTSDEGDSKVAAIFIKKGMHLIGTGFASTDSAKSSFQLYFNPLEPNA